MITVREDKRRLIRAGLVNRPEAEEVTLYCHSTDKEIKEEKIKNRFEQRFEAELDKVRQALPKSMGLNVTTRYWRRLDV